MVYVCVLEGGIMWFTDITMNILITVTLLYSFDLIKMELFLQLNIIYTGYLHINNKNANVCVCVCCVLFPLIKRRVNRKISES